MSSNLKAFARGAGHVRPVAVNTDILLSIEAVIAQLSTILIGKDSQIKLAVACLIARGHLLIEDVPGVGKTTLAHALGKTLGLSWTRIQFTSDLLPADVVGVSVFNATTHTFEFKPGPVFTSVLLADEINRAPAKAQSALLEAMEERQITVDGTTHPLPVSFFVIATQNASDQLGAYPLPESQLDRFLAGIEIGYPDRDSERTLLSGGDRRDAINQLTPVTDSSTLHGWSEAASAIPVSDKLLDYVQALLEETRQSVDTQTAVGYGQGTPSAAGLSPRAGLSLLSMARAWALVRGGQSVLPEDIQDVFAAVAGHRLTGSVRAGKILCSTLLDRVTVD